MTLPISTHRPILTARVFNAIRDAGPDGATVPMIKSTLLLPHKEIVSRAVRRLRGRGLVARWERRGDVIKRGAWTGRYREVRYVVVDKSA